MSAIRTLKGQERARLGTVHCRDCGEETGHPEWIGGSAYCDECWPDHADDDSPEDFDE